MRRSGRLIILIVVLVVLIAAAIVISLVTRDSSQAETVEEQTTILELDSSQVTNLTWARPDEKISFNHDGDTWVYAEDSGFPLDEKYLTTIMNTLSDLQASKVIENVSDFEQYGLEDPSCTVNIEGTENVTLIFGNTSIDEASVYLSIEDGNVYMVDATILEDFPPTLNDLVKMEEVPDMDTAYEVIVDADTQTLDIVEKANSGLAYSDNYIWFQDSDGTYTALDTELTESFIQNFTALNWDSCADYNATDLAQYGLETPAATVTVKYTVTTEEETGETDEDGNPVTESTKSDETFVLELGDYYGNYCYARITGSHMVYLLDATICDAALYTTVDSLLPDEVLEMDWSKVSSVDVTLNGDTYTFVREEVEVADTEDTEDTEDTSDEETEVETETIWSVNGTEVDGWPIWEALDDMASTGSEAGLTPERTEEIRFVIHQDNENFPTVELIFYQYDSSNCLVGLNGETRLFVSRSDVVDLTELVNEAVLDLT